MPRSRISGEARARVAALVSGRLGVEHIEDHLHAGDSEDPASRARLYLAFTRGTTVLDERTVAELRVAIDVVLEHWTVRLREALLERHGEGEGARLATAFAEAFPSDYTATTPVERAVNDVTLVAEATRTGAPQIVLDPEPADGATVLRLCLAGEPLVLADFLPILDHAGIRALVEDRVRIQPTTGAPVYLHRFHVHDRFGNPLDVARVGDRVVALLLAVRAQRSASDALNGLVVETDLDWRARRCAPTPSTPCAGLGSAARWWRRSGNPEPARRLFRCFRRAPATPTIPTRPRSSSRASGRSAPRDRFCAASPRSFRRPSARRSTRAPPTSTASC
jgi:glutamate dehydrogenase